MSYDPLDRLYGRLVEASRRSAPDSPARAITIADIYQHLVPYRTVRSELGFGELQEYEHTLLRLFAGERDYVHVDVPKVAEEFKRELRSPNPILGIYRDYAAVGVTVNTGASGAGADSDAPEVQPADATAEAPPAAPMRPAVEPPQVRPLWAAEELETPASARGAQITEVRPRVVEADARPEPAPEAGREAEPEPNTCWHCRERLPQGREVRFCPHCGIVQVATPCDDCGAPVEPAWKFCVLCGTARAPQPMATGA